MSSDRSPALPWSPGLSENAASPSKTTDGGKPRRQLQTRILVTILLVVTILFSGHGAISIVASNQERHSALAERARLLAINQTRSLAAPIWDYDDAQIEAALSALSQDPDFVSARILDEEGVPTNQLEKRPAAAEDLVVIERIEHPTPEGPAWLGNLELVLSTERMNDAQMRAALWHASVLITLMVAVLVSIYFSFSRISGPLTELINIIDDLTRGDNQVAVPATERDDEIGGIAKAIEFFRRNAIEVERLRSVHDRALADERLRIRAAIESSSDAVLILDKKATPIFVNQAFVGLFGSDLADLTESRFGFGVIARREALKIAAAVRRQGGWQGEADLKTKDGSPLPAALRINGIQGEAGITVGFVALGTDITERRLAELEIRRLAHHDPLTGLPNRILFQQRFKEALTQARRYCHSVSVLALDLDGFKAVNDTMGHGVGDDLLKAVSRRLRSCVRSCDIVSRLGGDEFAIIGNANQAADVADRIVESLSKPFQLGEHEVFIGTSIGIANYPADGETVEDLLRYADMALYQAKAAGRGVYRFFEPELEVKSRQRRQLELDLRQALDHDELTLHYQPQIDVETGRIVSFEALARWHHAARGWVPPGQFIQVAEESSLILSLGEWALNEACRKAKDWQDKAYGVAIAVNLSAAQFRYDVVSKVEKALTESGLEPRFLELEITESILMANTEAARQILETLRDMGVSIALDDFGTGYSSLSYLRHLPVDKLKIDRSFIAEIDAAFEARALVAAIANLGDALGMSVTAEGVESEDQLSEVRSVGCNLVQGFLLAKPSMASDFEDVLIRQKQPELGCQQIMKGHAIQCGPSRNRKKETSRLATINQL